MKVFNHPLMREMLLPGDDYPERVLGAYDYSNYNFDFASYEKTWDEKIDITHTTFE
jgi:hypothetical protein